MADVREFYEVYWTDGRTDSNPAETKELMRKLSTNLGRVYSGSREGLAALDAGCGNGKFTELLAREGFKASGVDLAEGALSRAKARCPGLTFRQGSLEQDVPFNDGEFDLIWCSEVLEHLFDVHGALSEFNRLLRPGGRVILTVPYHGLAKNLAIALYGFDHHFDPAVSHIRFFSRRTLTRSLARAGFAAESWDGFGRPWPFYKSFFVVAKKAGTPAERGPIPG